MSFTFTAPVKDPQAVLRHGVDWSAWLEAGETIATEAATSEGLTIDQVSQADGVVTYRVAGGTANTDYTVTCSITTSTGRTDERSVFYRVRER